ncbi:hypothetical protein A2V61_02490 [Candidatus Woesebacteria bacterium RBG_19FT_COMBO_47_8]|uniref:SIR2-like domain-containing protein n=1 Tax=Candidatus Woesebacteria bacterium RBG_13_46_13 TaxID=1802479 RepID=A0A1F7X4E9_9BACT|nr:MAG: hypothetical protein A2Y68_00770 [Candidatus Woesebacteria bacterium RBG_13_46_13]OGM17182.1 MAG: hypothetical protein A2V61_02490 [Candidatus Woesebacteria bacterium RBG_19FT_COMBO_47_8]HJX59448.1 hypothetical protein [Patescibacteria group bacterium]
MGKINTVFLFGAGASHDCGDIFPHQPPLGGELHSILVSTFPDTWGKLPEDLNTLFLQNFEKGMDSLWKKHSDISSLLLQQLGIYFNRFTPKNETRYGEIIKYLIKIKSDDTILSTLNYDCLLDGELTRNGFKTNYLIPPNKGGILLIKLHGSCNWFLDFEGMNRYVNFSSDMRIKAPIYSLNTPEKVTEKLTSDTPLYPVMALFTENKPAPLGFDFIEHIQKEWKNLILNVKQVIIVGVKPYPQDYHIWDPLRETHANIFYVGDKQKFEEWNTSSGRSGNTIPISGTFAEAMEKIFERLTDFKKY